ncbi:MAG: hypothetical protein WDN75_01195 [Bacteroidota bacterium]
MIKGNNVEKKTTRSLLRPTSGCSNIEISGSMKMIQSLENFEALGGVSQAHGIDRSSVLFLLDKYFHLHRVKTEPARQDEVQIGRLLGAGFLTKLPNREFRVSQKGHIVINEFMKACGKMNERHRK